MFFFLRKEHAAGQSMSIWPGVFQWPAAAAAVVVPGISHYL